MMFGIEQHRIEWRHRLPVQYGLVCAVALVALSVLVFGWIGGNDAFLHPREGIPAMVPATSAGFLGLCLSFALLMRGLHRIALGAAAGVALLAAVQVVAQAFGWSRTAEGGDRMSFATAGCFLLCAVCLIKAARPGILPLWMFDTAATVSGAVSLVALAGYMFNAAAIGRVALFEAMAPQTALCFVLFSAALLVERADRSWLYLLTGPGRGSRSARRLVPVVFVLPFVLCLAALSATRFGFFDADVRLAVLTVALTAALLLALLASAAADNLAETREVDQESRLRALIDGLDAAIMAFDADGRLRFSNRVADLWARDAGATSPLEWLRNSRFVDPISRVPIEGEAAGFTRPWEMQSRQKTLVGRVSQNGQVQILLLTGGSWLESNGARRHLLMLRDVTEENAAARARQQAERLGALGEVAGGIAHDVANILGIVRLSADIGLMQDNLDTVVRGELEEIQRACDRGAELTSRVQSFSGPDETEPEPVDLASLLPVVVEFAQRTLPPSIRIEFSAPSGPTLVSVERGLLENALLNLIVNARNAIMESRAGECITIRTEEEPEAVTIVIADDGPGMSDQTLARAEEPFYTTRAQSGGTGLGLVTVRRCADRAGGTFELSSEPGKGTTARLCLLRSADVPAADADRLAAISLAGRTILVVEDDEHYRKGLRRVLRSLGADVIDVATADRGLIELDSAGTEIDMVLTDLHLAGRIDGAALARAVAQRRPGLPVVIISGAVDAEETVRDLGVPLLRKPFDALRLAALIARLCEDSGRGDIAERDGRG